MKRIAMEYLINWKDSNSRKPLVVNGARQVGKTWLVRQFAKEHFKDQDWLINVPLYAVNWIEHLLEKRD